MLLLHLQQPHLPQRFGLRVEGFEFQVQGSKFLSRVSGLGFQVEGVGFMFGVSVKGFGCRR